MYFSSWALQHAVHISIIAVKIVSLEFSSSSNISVQTRGSLEQKQKYQSGQYNMHTEDQVQNSDCRLRSLYCFQPFFQFSLRQTHKFSYHTTAQKLEGIYSISLESSHKLNSTVAKTKLDQKFQNRVITGLRSSSSGECVTNKVTYHVTYLYNC